LESQLHSLNSDSRCVAAKRLGLKGVEAKSALPALKEMLDTTICPDFGEFADDPATDIEKIGGIDPLIETMRESHGMGRSAAAVHLKIIAARYPDRMIDLKAAFASGLKDSDGIIRMLSVSGLGELGQQATDLLPEILKLANDPD